MNPAPLTRLIEYWQTLTPARVQDLGAFYAPDAYFRDPFNEISGLKAITRVFNEMFERLHDPRFLVTDCVSEQDRAFLVWDFTFRIKSLTPLRERRIHGSTHLRFNADGLVTYHRDYWDAAGELYAQLPLLGPLIRAVTRRFA